MRAGPGVSGRCGRAGPHGLLVVVCLAGLPALVTPLAAQDQVDPSQPEEQEVQEESNVDWSGRAEIGSSFYFGRRDQSSIQTQGSLTRSSDLIAVKTSASFTYGEATDDDGNSFVSNRSWEFEMNFDYDPEERLHAYLEGSLRSSFEKRYDLRWDIGVGGTYKFLEERENRLELRAALSIEQTLPSERATRRPGDDNLEGKWSTRLQYRRSIADGRMTFSSENDYRPVYDRADVFTASSKNTLDLAITQTVSFRFTFVNKYDSEASTRGGTNNDGQLFFTISTRF